MPKTRFRFLEDCFEYRIADRRGDQGTREIRYDALGPRFDYAALELRWSLLRAALVPLVLLPVLLILRHPGETLRVVAFMSVFAPALVALLQLARRWTAVRYTAIPAAGGFVLVRRDRHHDAIVRELESRRERARGADGTLPARDAGAPVCLRQKALGHRSELRFHADHFEYDVDDGNRVSFKVRYVALPRAGERRELVKKDEARILVVFVGCVAAYLLLQRPQGDHDYVGNAGGLRLLERVAVFLLVLCGAYWLVDRLTRKRFTVIDVHRSVPVRVLHDSRRDAILGELANRRRAVLRTQAVIDERRPPKFELLRLRWLRDEGAITDQELEAFEAKLTIALAEPPTSGSTGPPPTVH